MILSFPNGEEAERCGSNWIGFRVDLEHLNYYCLKTISNTLARNGLYIENHWFSGQVNLLRSSLAGVARQSTIDFLALKLSNILLNPLPLNYGMGSFSLTVVARKI